MQEEKTSSHRQEALRLIVIFTLLATLIGGCASQARRPSALPSGDHTPVTLRDLQVTQSEGHRAVFIRLSRLPTLVQHSNSGDPARIMVVAWGPTGGEDLGERVLSQQDPYVEQVRVSRVNGGLRIILDLKGDIPPPHSVHEMADWVMIRFPNPIASR